MRLVLHIGMHKTGTTAVQFSFSKFDPATARDLGLLYPQTGRGKHAGHPHLPWKARGDGRYHPQAGGLAELVDEVAAAQPQVVVISTEEFTWDPDRTESAELGAAIADALKPDEARVIAYVRPQWDFLQSVYSQRVKNGGVRHPFPQFVRQSLDDPRYDYLRVFEPWRTHFGDGLDVRLYSSRVVEEVWEVAGLDAPETVLRANPRLGARKVEMLRALREDMHRRGVDRSVLRPTFAKAQKLLADAVPDDEPFQGLTDELVATIAERFETSNRTFAKEFLGQEPETAFPRPTGLAPSTWTLADASADERRVFEQLLAMAAG